MKRILRRMERERLPWFILLSLLVHHTSLTLFFHPPEQRHEQEKRYEIVELEDFTPEQKEALERDVPALPAMSEAEPERSLLEKMKKEEKRDVRKPEEPKEEEKKKEEKKKEEEKDRKKETAEVEVIPMQGLHYVDVRSHESEKPPEEAKYFAPINSVVEEETRAERTNLDHDDGMSTPARSDLVEDDKPGDSEKSKAAHEIEMEKIVEQEKGNENKKGEEVLAAQTEKPSSSSEEAKKQKPQEEVLMEQYMVKPVPITPDNAPELNMKKTEDGEIIDPSTGKPVPAMTKFFDAAKKRKKIEGAETEGEGAGKEMDIAWQEFEGMFAKQMQQEKKAYEEAKKSHTKGRFTKNIDKVMSQLENFNPEVKPGKQTALNAAYHPFAEYITAFHRKLHPQWGGGYIESLYSQPPSHPHNDWSLWVKLEFVVNPDGTIDKVTVVHSSGDLAFDVAGIDSIYGGQPYPPPPDVIKSYDGKVYLRWRLNRNESQCGVWNAEPYIIPAPSGKMKKPKKPPAEIAPGKTD